MSLPRFLNMHASAMVVLLTVLSFSHGHMIMSFPEPYGHLKTPYTSVNPLSLSDSSLPFPCQGLSNAESTSTLTAGQNQLVNFTGGAQHGGGSCQFSISYDGPSAPKDKWKVIYTLIGGCPVLAAGNLPPGSPDPVGRADSVHCGNDSGTECIRQFDVPIPQGLKPGKAVFAWTWFNKIGNREMYMSCAPVEIKGGDADEAFMDALPQTFVANVPGECKTGQGVLNIPNPGKFGKVLEQPATGSEGSCPKAAGVPTFEGGSLSGSSNSTSSGSESGSTPSTSSATPVTTSSMPLQVNPADETPTIAAIPTTGTTSSVPSSGPSSDPVPSPTFTQSRPTSGSSSTSAESCSTDGAIVCIGSSQWGLCDHGHAVPQALAPGTMCSNGAILRRRSWSF